MDEFDCDRQCLVGMEGAVQRGSKAEEPPTARESPVSQPWTIKHSILLRTGKPARRNSIQTNSRLPYLVLKQIK